MRAYLAILALAAACGSDSKKTSDANTSGSDDASVAIDAPTDAPVDSKIFMDAPPDVPPQITISGVASSVGVGAGTPQQGVTIEAYLVTDETTPIATATTDAQGAYTLTITTNGVPVDGYVKATKSGFLVTYLYPPWPLVSDFGQAAVELISQQTLNGLSVLAGATQDPANGFIGALVVDAAMMPVTGATVSSNPAASDYRYNGNGGLPSSSATSTAADGLGYMFNVSPTATVSVTAAKTGSTFKSHNVKARAGAITTTVITP